MGGSLALALRERCQSLLGCDNNPGILDLANKQNLFTKLSSDPAEIMTDADVVILATPLKTIVALIQQLPELHPGSPIVLDLGSTKVRVVQALEDLPSRFDPLGGHPMCGKEKSGFENADVNIFLGAAFAFTTLERTSNNAQIFAEQLAKVVGAHPLWVDPKTHDQWSAATSHLAYVVASALAGSTPVQSKPLVGSGFRSATRIAATPAGTMLDVLETNRDNILEHLDRFIERIEQYRNLLSSEDYPALKVALDEGADKQRYLAASQEDS
jgi:prephenate dehydrogenase